MQEVEKQFESAMQERTHKIQSHLTKLEEKISELNTQIQNEKQSIPNDIERKGSELQEILKKFQQDFDGEKKDRIHREGRILKQMHDYEEHAQEQLDTIQKDRDDIVLELRQMLEASENGRKEADQKFQDLISKELNSLKKDVQTEIKERKLEDDEIVEALNRYTRNLQSSLSLIHSMGK